MRKMLLIGVLVCGAVARAEHSQTSQIAALTVPPPLQQMQTIESLWANDPVSYFKTVSETFKNWAKTNATIENKQAVWTTFTNAMRHPIPTSDHVLAKSCLGAKASVMQIYTGMPLPERKLEDAKFLGEIRSLRTYDPFEHPLYKHWDGLPDQLAHRTDLTNEMMRAAFLEKATKNQVNWDSDQFQRELCSQEQGLLFSLNHTVPTFRGKIEDYTNYVNQIATAARLTEDEKNQLLGIKKP